MTVGIMQPYFIPYIGYWQLIHAVDTFVIYDDVNYIKQGYINKNSILLNNKKYDITLEVMGASSNKLINEVKVGKNSKKILKTIQQSYAKAPFFNNTISIIEQILSNDEKNLAKFVGHSIFLLTDYLKIETNIIYASNMDKNNTLKAQDKVIDICKKINASRYINAIGGQNLYSKDFFNKHHVDLYFLQTQIQEYKQFTQNFIPYLSIIDIIMFNDKETIKKMLKKYELI